MKADRSEIDLLHALALGQVEAFDALYHRYKQPVYSNIVKLVRQTETAEDILQEVFVTLWTNRQKIDLTKSVGGWLFVVSYNKAASFLKKKVRESAVVQGQADLPDTPAIDDQSDEELYRRQMALIDDAVAHLPARKRDVFCQCRFEGLSSEEVAGITGLSVQSVNDYLKQSTRFIREYIQANAQSAQLVAITYFLLLLDQ